jgi:iron-sulfur cluster assembly protein
VLTLSRSAGEAIKDYVRSSPEIAEDVGGIRLFLAESGGGKEELAITLSHMPEFGDEMIEQDGARVFIEESIRDYVADKELDVTDAQEDGRPGFRLTQPDT